MKIAVGYVRCSTDMQDESIAQQKKSIENWAKVNSFKIIEWFEDEGRSGTNFDRRPSFMRMIRRAENHPNFEFVLVYDESRWGRAGNPRESSYWKVHLEKHGVIVRIINSQSKHENDIGSYVVEVVESAEASEYSKKLSRSTLRGCIDNALKGFSNGGTAPYGYRRIAINKITGEIIRELMPGERRREGEEKVIWDIGDEEEVAIVRRIFQLKNSGYGYRAIANLLNNEGIPCPKRGRWKNKNQKWSSVTIQTLCTNRVYCGDRVYNRHPLNKKRIAENNVLGKTKERWINDESFWVVQKGAHPSIISRDLFESVNNKRKDFQKINQHHYESPYLLSGLIKCEKCGFNYQGESHRKYNKFYYVDGGNMNKGQSVCGRLSIRKEKLEGFILEMIKGSIPFSKSASRFEELIHTYLSNRLGDGEELKTITRKLKENDQKLKNVLDLVEKGISSDTVLFKIRELEKTKGKLEEEKLKAERYSIKDMDVQKVAGLAADFFLNFEKNFEIAPIQEKKQFLRQVVLGVRVNPENRTATCAITKIPMVNKTFLSIFNPSEFRSFEHLSGARCSGDRT